MGATRRSVHVVARRPGITEGAGGTDPAERSPTVRVLAALALFAALLGQPLHAGAGGPTNLLTNPGAEAGAGAGSSSEVEPPPGWNTAFNFTAVSYGATGGFPDAQASESISGGANFFAGGPNNDGSFADQRFDVSNAADAIDAGTLQVAVRAYFGGFEDQTDAGLVSVDFRTGADERISIFSIGPVSPSERGLKTIFLYRTGVARVPDGTRLIIVTLVASGNEGSYNDAYFDNVEFVSELIPPKCRQNPQAICGSSGRDRIIGTPGDDVIYAGGGDDYIDGQGGSDTVYGQGGDDEILATPAPCDQCSVVLFGGAGGDQLRVKFFADEACTACFVQAVGGGGRDVIEFVGQGVCSECSLFAFGFAGADRLVGSQYRDELLGAEGNDDLRGREGNDRLEGGAGDDRLNGGAGKDKCKGGPGKDTLTRCE